MFWKKGDKDELELDLKEGARSSFRVAPLPDEPLILLIEGQPCRVYDISAGGALFQAPHQAMAGDIKELMFKLPYPSRVITGKIRIVTADRDRARGGFVDLSDEDKDQIHLYVLETQKRRLKREARAKHPEPSE